MAQPEPYLKCACKNCGGHIEFPTAGAGRTVECPHCKWRTVLGSEGPAPAPIRKSGNATRQKFILAGLGAALLVIAAGGGIFWYKGKAPPVDVHSAPAVTRPSPATSAPVAVVAPEPPPDPWHGLMAGPVNVEKPIHGGLIYALGTLHNASDHQRFGVKVELDIFNATNEKVGTATDYTGSIDPGKDWHFRALVTDRSAATAQITSVKEN